VPQDNAPVRVLTFAGLKDRGIPFSRQHLGRLEAAGRFPARIQLGASRVGWVESEVDEWIRGRPRGPIDVVVRKPAKGAAA
jgi:prophage regulatory protein